MPDLEELDCLIESPTAVNGKLSRDDIRVLPLLRSAAVVKDLKVSPQIRDYFETMMDLSAIGHYPPSKEGFVMKRMHVHVSVEDLQHSIGFYSALFAAEPAVVKPDYAKWMLEDPRVNFAISTRGRQPGLDHLGIQVESNDELHEVYARLHKAGGEVIEQGETACCYAKSEKSWIDDPAGIAWETFHTIGEVDRLWRWHGRTRGPGRQRKGLLRAKQP